MEKLVIKIPRKYIFGLVLLAVLAFSSLPHKALALHGNGPPEDLVAIFTDQQNILLNALELLAISDFDGTAGSNEKAVLLEKIKESYDLVSQALAVEPKDKNWADADDDISKDADSVIKSFNANKARLKIGSSVSLNKEKATEILKNPSNYSEEEIAQAGAVLSTATGISERNKKIYETPITCDGWRDLGSNLWTCGLYSIGSGILWLFSKLVYLAGILFDTALRISVLQMKTYVGSPSVNLVWGTVRDLANIVFIFFLLWISIQTILGLDNAKKHLAGIIITALLINFSLFFTRIIIDTSNIVALQFYNGIIDQNCNSDYDGCVSDNLMKATKLSTVYDTGKSGAKIPITTTNTIIITIFGSIFFLITAFVLLQAAFMFIARTVALVLLAAISPLAFVSNIVPKMKSYHDDWWKNVINQALVAPIFLLFIWIVIKISSTVEGGGLFTATAGNAVDTGSFADAFINGGKSMDIVFGFFFLIGLMYFALKITKDYSGKFGGAAVEFGSKVLGGTTGWALRGTVGRGMNLLSQNWAPKNAFTRGLHRYVVNPAAEANYDFRGAGNLPLVGGALKDSGAVGGLGKPGGKGGFKAFEKAAEKADVDYSKTLKPEAQKEFAESLGKSGLLGRFITLRTAKSATGAAETINKQVEKKRREKADEERLKKMKEDFAAHATEVLRNESEFVGVNIAKTLSETNGALIEKIEEKYEAALESQRSEKSALLDIAKREQDTEKIGDISKTLGELNTNIRKIRERKQLERTMETRDARKEQQSQSKPPGGGSGDSGGEDKK